MVMFSREHFKVMKGKSLLDFWGCISIASFLIHGSNLGRYGTVVAICIYCF